MRVLARHRKDVATALENTRQYRDIAEEQGVIKQTSPAQRLTEARHALQAALMPQEGALPYQQPARRQRDILRAVEEITRAAQQFGKDNIVGHNKALEITGNVAAVDSPTLKSLDEQISANAVEMTKPRVANQAFMEQSLARHVREAMTAISEAEQSHQHNGDGAATQILTINAAARVMAIAYTQEAKHEGASLSARHGISEFASLYPNPSRPMVDPAPQAKPATGP